MKFRNSQSRRQFLQGSLLATGSLCSAAAKPRSPGERLRLGFVGLGGQGRRLLDACQGQEVSALCDLDPATLHRAASEFPRASRFPDFRRMLDSQRLDGLLVATPDHTHAVILGAALRLGIPVFCSDPLARTVSEARAIALLAHQTGTVSQVAGSWLSPGLEAEVARRLQQGEVGEVGKVQAWSSRPSSWSSGGRPNRVNPEAWLGPLFSRPLPESFGPGGWRDWWDFGGGTLAATGTPPMDLMFRAMRLQAPREVSASGPALHLERCPEWLVSRWLFAREGSTAPLEVLWQHGSPLGGADGLRGLLPVSGPEGLTFHGTGGTLRVSPGTASILRPGKPEELIGSEGAEAGGRFRLREWLDACRDGRRTSCPVGVAAAVAECLLLGNVAFRTDRRLVWDRQAMAAQNLPEASDFLQHSYRPGWRI